MRTVIVALAFVLTLVGVAERAGADDPLSDEGTLIRLDPPSRVVMLEDGRMYRAVAGTAFVVGSRSETYDRLRPGARIVVIGGEPVVYRQGRYIALPAVPPSLGLAVAPDTLIPAPATWRPAGIVQPPSHIFPATPTLPTAHNSP
jgi:hypothetical protein